VTQDLKGRMPFAERPGMAHGKRLWLPNQGRAIEIILSAALRHAMHLLSGHLEAYLGAIVSEKLRGHIAAIADIFCPVAVGLAGSQIRVMKISSGTWPHDTREFTKVGQHDRWIGPLNDRTRSPT
jgi:hypothetical protein